MPVVDTRAARLLTTAAGHQIAGTCPARRCFSACREEHNLVAAQDGIGIQLGIQKGCVGRWRNHLIDIVADCHALNGHVAVAAKALKIAAHLFFNHGALLQHICIRFAGTGDLACRIKDLAGGNDHRQHDHYRDQQFDDSKCATHQSSLTVA